MMNRLLNKNNPKDKFIIDTLLPYLVDHVEGSINYNEIVDQVSSMYIFPYKTNEGTRLGSLKEPGISWYFDKNNYFNTISSSSYRIFDESIMTEKNAEKFRKNIKEYCEISEFSNQVVIKDLLYKMSNEIDYTEQWWMYAYDVFTLWHKEDFYLSLEKATAGMKNNNFLFLEDKYSDCLKKKLLKNGVFSDIIKTSFNTPFWNLIKNSKNKDKAIDMLIKMGVPYTFVVDGTVNEHLLAFFERLSENIEYPVEFWEEDFEQCELSQDIMLEIYREDQDAFLEIAEDSDINIGMVLKNILGAYVPLAWDLFYSSKNYEEEEENIYEELDDCCEENTNSYLESLHIDEKEYEERLLNNLEQCHEFSEVCETADEYILGVMCETVDFYKWIWTYSQHEKLIENIMDFYTAYGDEREQVPESDIEFVLSILSCEDVIDYGYFFDMNLSAEECFNNADVLNDISNRFSDIYCIVISDLEWFDVSDYLSQIIAAVKSRKDIPKIASDPIWNHVYLVDDAPDYYDDIYVRCKLDNEYEDVLLLWKSSDDDSYIRALAKYVSAKYDTEVDITCAETFDWKEEYLNLAKSIHKFITETESVVKESELYGYTANMADVLTFYDERKLWQKLFEQREKIVCQTVGKDPINLNYWREFLTSKYKGRCQVCGKKTVTGEQNAHFFTYRINKESQNRLANLSSNMFCVCPSCHGEMQYGSYMGKDMNEILEKAKLYWEYYDSKCNSGEMNNNFESLVSELANDSDELEGFIKPITCDVIVNGKLRKMAFSWEHFIILAFILKDSLQLDIENKEEY